MSVFLALVDPSFLADLLSEQAKADLTQKIIVVIIVWLMMGRQVNRHFKSLEAKLDQLVLSLTEVKTALSTRIDNVEERLERIENK